MKLAGITIIYYPEEDLSDNIQSYIQFVDKLILWDNTPSGNDTPGKRIFPFEDKIVRMGTGVNAGIGEALNQAIAYAGENGYTHLLTMDQDSAFQGDSFKRYTEFIDANPDKSINAFFTPNYLMKTCQSFPVEEKWSRIKDFMTSGTIFPLPVIDKVGLFRADFFVDTIDIEYALRARSKGIEIIALHAVVLKHGAGYQGNGYKLFGKTYYPNEYSPMRTYYMIRNALITYREFPDRKMEKDYFRYWLYKRFCFIILFEKDKIRKLKALLYGYIHGKKGITGKRNIFNENE